MAATLALPEARYEPYRPPSTSSTSPLKQMVLAESVGYSPSHGGNVNAMDSQYRGRYEELDLDYIALSKDDAVSFNISIQQCANMLVYGRPPRS